VIQDCIVVPVYLHPVYEGYVVLEVEENELQVAFIRTPYDIERAAQAIEASEMPNEYSEMIRTGTG